MISSKWNVIISLAAMALLVVVALYPSAWSLDLSVSDDTCMTPVSALQNPGLEGATALPATTDGTLGVDEIKSLQYNPKQAKTAGPQTDSPVSVNPVVTPKVEPPPVTPAFVVLPVMIHSAREKAFSDLPVMLSSEVANQLTVHGRKEGFNYKVMNPVYTYDELKEKGLDGLYNRVIRDYLEAGQPNEKDLNYLAEQLSNKNQRVQWVVFVQADFDTNRPDKPAGLQIPLRSLIDHTPPEPNFYLKGIVQAYSLDNGVPRIWNKTSQSAMRMSRFGNFTKSVFEDGDSALSFKSHSTRLAKVLVSSLPEAAYAVQTSVQASITPQNFHPGAITPEIQDTLKRILNN